MDFKIWPNIQVVNNNSSALIYCDSVLPAAWTHDGKPLSMVSNSLLLPLVTNEEKGVYLCHGQLPSGQKFISSSVILGPDESLHYNSVNKCFANKLNYINMLCYKILETSNIHAQENDNIEMKSWKSVYLRMNKL